MHYFPYLTDSETKAKKKKKRLKKLQLKHFINDRAEWSYPTVPFSPQTKYTIAAFFPLKLHLI